MENKINKKKWIFLLSFIAFLTVFLGYQQIKQTIYSPFVYQKSDEPKNQEEAEKIIFNSLSQQDTDQDGLSDFEESFVYQTSAYIVDSDSDAFSDKEEIDAQSDPLNAKSTPYHKIVDEQELDDLGLEEKIEQPYSLSIQEIKDLLINKAGISQEIMDNLDDKMILKLYNETKQETGIDLQNLKASEDLTRQFSNLEISQLREILIQQGADPVTINSLDDETLELMLIQSLDR